MANFHIHDVKQVNITVYESAAASQFADVLKQLDKLEELLSESRSDDKTELAKEATSELREEVKKESPVRDVVLDRAKRLQKRVQAVGGLATSAVQAVTKILLALGIQ
jgi:capsule polysaccharide export protein KpsE/RkpR